MLAVVIRTLLLAAFAAALSLCLGAPAAADDASCSRLVIQERGSGRKLQIIIVDREDGDTAEDPKKAPKAKKIGKKAARRVFITKNAQVPAAFYENMQYKSDEEIELVLNPPAPPPSKRAAEGQGTLTLDEVAGEDRSNYYVRKALETPDDWVTIEGASCRALTAAHWVVLKRLIRERFPGRGVIITSTVTGRHMSESHPDGTAIDFCVSPLTREESSILEELCRKAGFSPFNEYIHDSPYKTGDHMHVSL